VRAVVVGLGAVGARVVRQLISTDDVERLTIVHPRPERVLTLIDALGAPDRVRTVAGDVTTIGAEIDGHDVAVLAVGGELRRGAEAALERGMHVVATGDDPAQVRSLLSLDLEARERGLTVAAGVSLAPGLSCVLAAHAGRSLVRVEEVHVASMGTGGPSCARRHHAALSSTAIDWRDGAWRRHPGGSGRELVWFPEPVGGADCYRADLADPILLVPAFPGVRRVTARLEATRRDRMTAWLPMLRRPHPEGTVGAIRADVRGWTGDVPAERILGAVVRPALGAAVVAAQTAAWAAAGRLARAGAGGLAELVGDPARFLRELAGRGVRTAMFEGSYGEDPRDRGSTPMR